MANETPDDGPEQRRITTDPERIREWAQAHDAVPVTIRDSDDHGYSFARQGQLEADHEEYTWDEFIETFDNENLVFVYHEDDPSGEELGHFEIVEREAAFDRASLGRNELEDQLREGKTVTTEIVETQVVETEVVERDTIESEVVDTELAERRVVDSELLSRELVDTEFVSDDVIEVVTDETRLETIEEIERYTIESQVVDVDIEQREELEHDEIETNIELESVQRSILESNVVRADVTADEVVDQEVIRSKRTEGDIVQSELIERRTIEEQIDERTQMRFTLEETELLESTVVSSDVLEGEIIDVEEYGATDTTAETEASAGTDTPTVDTPVELSSDDQGKDVVDETGQQIGIVAEVEGQTAYIDPEPGLTDRLKARLNWGGHGDDDYPVDSSAIDQITDDEVVLESDDE
ncbi:hypothetical protein [Natronorubrum sulfidifaciens]|uniref:DUF2382 domain-containing protein n=1 Tax=Natronorubrum sulfidifaciens JCM 14089 TaxID=1230460 RepID=L9W4P0_9EURY|nr:hypothetical protein [Natronorubrum sulfidifaciens]ELY44429.1 hypothetical protein C495_11019 [Natronorubrum sulfidifaciens JCM 14089]